MAVDLWSAVTVYWQSARKESTRREEAMVAAYTAAKGINPKIPWQELNV